MEEFNSSPQLVHVDSKIILTEKEQLLFELLIKVVQHYDLKIELRVAGGWVRDKLLGMDSEDIDIALYKMKGRPFCDKIAEYLSCIGDTTVAAVNVISHNSEKAKDLGTAKMQLYGICIDFGHLRSEVYTVDSRIPNTDFASPKDDALRRDLTINSLFYNIINDSIEDFTGQGARFGFMLDEELKRAAKTAEVKSAITEKLNQELIGHEVELMICGKDPVKAMIDICDLSLFSVVFNVPPKFELPSLLGFERLCIANMDVVTNLMKLLDCDRFSDDDRRLILYAALLLPLRKFTYNDNKSKKIPLVCFILRDSLKLEMNYAKMVIMIHKAAEKFASLIPYFIYGNNMGSVEVSWEKQLIDIPLTSKLRVYTGLLLDEIKRLWRISLLVSTLLFPDTLDLAEYTNGKIDLNKKREVFNEVENKIAKSGLEEVASGNLKQLVDGKDIMNALRLESASSVVGEWQKKVRQWQLAHPLGTKEECINWIEETI